MAISLRRILEILNTETSDKYRLRGDRLYINSKLITADDGQRRLRGIFRELGYYE
jgi:hypothetical protein